MELDDAADDPNFNETVEFYWPPCHQGSTMAGMVDTGQEQRVMFIRYSLLLQSLLLILAIVLLCFSWNQLFYYNKTCTNYRNEGSYFEEVDDDDDVIPESIELLRANDPVIIPVGTVDIEMQM